MNSTKESGMERSSLVECLLNVKLVFGLILTHPHSAL